jgi:DNA topoisomerase-1
MKQLHHNGVLVPPRYEEKRLTIKVRGETIKLTPDQEEMVIAWAKKMGTPYVEDRIFTKNFYRDFSKKLGINVKPGDIDYSEILSFIEEERAQRVNLPREKRRRLAAQRKAQRETNKERYGYAWADGVQMEVANYTVEPSSIFIGRGRHPLRGRWKEGPREGDIELNLSPDAPKPPDGWKAIVWQPDAMWIARWQDKLTGKMKYVWLSDSSILKQRKDIEKFDKARQLCRNRVRVQGHIWENLDANDLRRRKTATVCFLIDKLKIRVGDEKDPDEADTVGASTLRPEHIHFNGDSTVTFNFLGKDSVPHVFMVKLPENVVRNLKEFATSAESTIFDGVDSKHVSEFLNEVMSGLSAKVFRTYYASEAVERKLDKSPVKGEDSEYMKKYFATMANLEAAKICNHRCAIPKNWKFSLEKNKVRLKILKERAREARMKLRQKAKELEERYMGRLRKQEEQLEALRKKLETYRRQLAERKQQGNPVGAMKKRSSLQRNVVALQNQRLNRLKAKHGEQMKKLKEKLERQRQNDKAAIEKLNLQIESQKETRGYNLRTSLKSYIDPRAYYEWGKRVDYDWKRYYPQSLQRKFSWVETDEMS